MAKSTSTFKPSTPVKQGDIITNPNDLKGGAHVVLRDHVTGSAPPQSGASNDLYHYTFSK